MVLCPGLLNSMMTKSEGIKNSIFYRTLLGKGIEQFTPQNPKERGPFIISPTTLLAAEHGIAEVSFTLKKRDSV